MHAVFEYLARRDITPKNVAARVFRWHPRTVIKLISDVEELVHKSWSATRSPFSFVANSQLSGGIHPCGAAECRLKRVDRLGRFAVLYADQVTIQNPVAQVATISDWDWARGTLVGSLYVLWYLKPLIDAGLVVVTNPATAFCEEHLPTIVKSGTLKKIEGELRRQYGEQLTVHAEQPRGSYSATGPESLLEHDTVFDLSTDGDRARRARRTLTRLPPGPVPTKIKNRIISSIVRPVLSDILHQQVLGTRYDLQYLTDRDVDFLALRQASEPGLRAFSRALAEGLAHSVPTLEQLSFKDLLRLRRDEGEVFAVYRDAVARVLREVGPADSSRVRQAFQDAVLPELNKIDALVTNEQKRLRRSATTDLLCGLGAVSIGLFTGMLTPDAVKLITQLGGVGFLTKSLHGLRALKTAPEQHVRNNPFYFLWKARDHARRQTK
jgi:hypothetical protein